MNISIEALIVLFYLTPGLFASMFLDLVLVRKEKDAMSRLIEALVFSFITYGLTALYLGSLPVTVNNVLDATGKVIARTLTLDPEALVPTVLIGLALPLTVGHVMTTSWFMHMLRLARITGRTGRESTWLDVFHDQKQYIVVYFTDGRRLFGWPSYYSDALSEGLLYLSDAMWQNVEDESKKEAIAGVFIIGLDKIDHIEFKNPRNRKFNRWILKNWRKGYDHTRAEIAALVTAIIALVTRRNKPIR